MKTVPSKPKLSAIASSVQQALLASATQNPSVTSSSPATSEIEQAKTRKSAELPDFDTLPDSGFVRLPTLLLLFACSRATIWRWVKTGKIPAPVKLGPRITAWPIGQLRQAILARMKGEPDAALAANDNECRLH